MTALAGAPGAGDAAAPPARDLILITVDTLRADALGFAGNRQAATPVLDRLAASGRVFTGAHAHAVTTLPSHASMLTGLEPPAHGARKNGSHVLGEGFPTLATLLSAAGFATGAFVGAYPLAARFGLDRGFEVYDDELAGSARDPVLFYAERPGSAVVARALAWWRAERERRRFLWLHLFEPHAPYEPPEPFASRHAANPYLGEVAAADAFLSPLLEGFLKGDEEPALIVFTSDHGEALGEHGEATHGLFAYEPTLAVPLVLWGAGVEVGRDARPARHVDLLPTLLAAAGLPPAKGLPGRSLLSAPGEESVTYFESVSTYLDYGWAPLRGVIRDGRKLIQLPLPELYDLAADPGETRNLFGEQPEEARLLARLLARDGEWPPEAGTAAPEVDERLRALGYLGGRPRGRTRFGPEDDPKNLVELDRALARMNEAGVAGELKTAIEAGLEILERRPGMTAVYLHVAAYQIRAGDPAGAVATLEAARARGAASRDVLRQLGLTLAASGRPREAVELLRPLADDPREVEARNHLALALDRLGRRDEALELLREALEIDPDFAPTHENLSYLELQRQRFAAAREHARRAVELDPGRLSAWKNLGLAEVGLGSEGAAAEAWRRAAELAPADGELLFNLAVVEARSGLRAAARETLRRFLALPAESTDPERRRNAEALLESLSTSG